MIELINNALVFRFPEVHSEATCTIDFQRTLRIPDDNREYPLPPGLGRFPVEHVDDFAERLPESWRQHGGVMIPMYQSEAMWVNFSGKYPCAVKIAAGKINAVSGKAWSNELSADPQDYVVIPEQPWLDGFNVSEDHIRQFVAMPLGEGYTAEEQITDEAQYGGLQIIVYPMKPEAYEQYRSRKQMVVEDLCCYSLSMDMEMGLAPGGLMKQKIYEDEYGIDSWDQEHGSRCFVHIANSAVYETIVGRKPPHEPPTAREYTAAGLPWFDYYADTKALEGSKILSGLTSLAAKAIEKTGKPPKDNAPVEPKLVKEIHSNNIVREGEF
ncbi:hypothetical protein MIT9_P0272 [Methylomarinovum caldicuralii]|uniref:Integral membrane protein n=1 Tax=Methylomarinovum caldicuralii TaxID=438856 RepID=A0AAU9BQH9_9GAMM|nr:hypothetical protein [Methylomarinovum caldicuralii]BCX80696.1 hypothetical protein MIT9_P0272 [Methylomarinovum caldicuralii]